MGCTLSAKKAHGCHCKITLDNVDQSWQPEEVPNDWRKVNITPVLKKGKEKDPRNNRSTSHTSVPGKGNGVANPGKHFQAHKGQENNQD